MFLSPEVSLIGHIISIKGVRPNPESRQLWTGRVLNVHWGYQLSNVVYTKQVQGQAAKQDTFEEGHRIQLETTSGKRLEKY